MVIVDTLLVSVMAMGTVTVMGTAMITMTPAPTMEPPYAVSLS